MFGRRSWFPWRTALVLLCAGLIATQIWPGLKTTAAGVGHSVAAWAVGAFAVVGSLLIVGSALFWVFLAGAFILLAYVSVDDQLEDHEAIPLIAILGVGVALWLFGDFNIFKYVLHNFWKSLAWLGVYLAVGGVYSYFKFLSHGRRIGRGMNEDFQERKERFRYAHGLPDGAPIPEALARDWNWLLEEYRAKLDLAVSPARSKGLILSWVYCWIFNAVSSFIRNPLRWLSKAVWYALRDLYEGAAKKVVSEFGNFEDAVKVPEEKIPPEPSASPVPNGRRFNS